MSFNASLAPTGRELIARDVSPWFASMRLEEPQRGDSIHSVSIVPFLIPHVPFIPFQFMSAQQLPKLVLE